MGKIPRHEELEALSDDELVSRYNVQAGNTVVGASFYRDELMRRKLAKESSRMLKLTWIILIFTAANVALVAVPYLNLCR